MFDQLWANMQRAQDAREGVTFAQMEDLYKLPRQLPRVAQCPWVPFDERISYRWRRQGLPALGAAITWALLVAAAVYFILTYH